MVIWTGPCSIANLDLYILTGSFPWEVLVPHPECRVWIQILPDSPLTLLGESYGIASEISQCPNWALVKIHSILCENFSSEAQRNWAGSHQSIPSVCEIMFLFPQQKSVFSLLVLLSVLSDSRKSKTPWKLKIEDNAKLNTPLFDLQIELMSSKAGSLCIGLLLCLMVNWVQLFDLPACAVSWKIKLISGSVRVTACKWPFWGTVELGALHLCSVLLSYEQSTAWALWSP